MRGPDGRIVGLVNLYGRISFNIGPTLASWMERQRPDVLADARAGDQAAIERSGFGAALMQPYGHPILPLCEPHEKRLQFAWGVADFRHRFGRYPEGVWLPECAVDLASLEVAADFNLRFAIVAPEQVVRIRPLSGGAWHDVSGSRVPPHRPYFVRLPSGRKFTVFVFDGPVSRGTAFGGLLHSTEALINGFRGALDGIPEADGVALLAADGETFGHHQRGAEERLAEALVRARMGGMAQVTHLADVYHRLEPTHEAVLGEPSSWSCAHGVGRWERDCGCAAGPHGHGWSWQWRGVLRHAVETLRDRVFALVQRRGTEMFEHPWGALEEYGELLVQPPSPDQVRAFLERNRVPGLDAAGQARALSMLELVRQVLFSSTSCGWFFDDISGLEAVQVMRHAARAAQLSREVFGIDPEPDLVHQLAEARTNRAGGGTGADVYQLEAAVAVRDPLEAVAMHAVRLLRLALEERLAPAMMSAAYGIHALDETVAPRVKRDGESVEVAGAVKVRHLRTGVTLEAEYRAESPGPGRPVVVEVDGKPLAGASPDLRETVLGLTAWRASRLLPAPGREVLVELAWIGREARELGAPLPPPFPEAIAGGARALIRELLETPPGSPRAAMRAVEDALAAAAAAGVTPEELSDLRPAIERQFALLARWTLAADANGDTVDALARAMRVAREVVGEVSMSRVRRWLASRPAGMNQAHLMTLADAAGMSGSALAPVDTPVRPLQEEIKDALA